MKMAGGNDGVWCGEVDEADAEWEIGSERAN